MKFQCLPLNVAPHCIFTVLSFCLHLLFSFPNSLGSLERLSTYIFLWQKSLVLTWRCTFSNFNFWGFWKHFDNNSKGSYQFPGSWIIIPTHSLFHFEYRLVLLLIFSVLQALVYVQWWTPKNQQLYTNVEEVKNGLESLTLIPHSCISQTT